MACRIDTRSRELAPSVCGRVPVRFDRDERYVDHRFQLMPRRGFTALFARMLRHDNPDHVLTHYREGQNATVSVLRDRRSGMRRTLTAW